MSGMSHELILGDFKGHREPDWGPLLQSAGGQIAVVENFMWMFEIELDNGMPLQAYKHWETRRYLHLGPQAEAFVFVEPKRYRRVCGPCLLDLALMPRRLDVRRENELLRRMMRRCGWSEARSKIAHG